jgi:hypothetical protein
MSNVEVEVDRMEAANAVAVEAADVTRFPMVEQNLVTLRSDRGGEEHDASVGRPVWARFEAKFEVAECLIAD